MVDMYRSHPAVQGIEPVNEPWQYTPIKTLKVSKQAKPIKPNQIKSNQYDYLVVVFSLFLLIS